MSSGVQNTWLRVLLLPCFWADQHKVKGFSKLSCSRQFCATVSDKHIFKDTDTNIWKQCEWHGSVCCSSVFSLKAGPTCLFGVTCRTSSGIKCYNIENTTEPSMKRRVDGESQAIRSQKILWIFICVSCFTLLWLSTPTKGTPSTL